MILPFLLSFIYIFSNNYELTQGFSGIAAGFMRYALFTLIEYKLEKRPSFVIIGLAFLISVLISSFMNLNLVSKANKFVILILIIVISYFAKEEIKLIFKRKEKINFLETFAYFFFLLFSLGFLSILLPNDFITTIGGINLIVHYFGFVLGLFVPLLIEKVQDHSKATKETIKKV